MTDYEVLGENTSLDKIIELPDEKWAQPSLWYRLRYAWYMMEAIGYHQWSFAWDAANAIDIEFMDDLTPKDAVYEELSHWYE